MSYWAELDDSGTVLRTVVGDDNETDAGYGWIASNLGGHWIRTYNDGTRVRYALPGMVYDIELDAFFFPKPNDGDPLWFFNDVTVQWELPKPDPDQVAP